MSFRQFPATGNDGNAYIILEFHDEHGGPDGKPSLRYELADGQRLQRKNDRFANAEPATKSTPVANGNTPSPATAPAPAGVPPAHCDQLAFGV